MQDLWPQNLKSTGHIKNRFILKLVDILVRIIYFCGNKIFSTINTFKKYISKQTKKNKLIYHPNSFKVPKEKIKLRSNHDKLFKNSFCVTFCWKHR